MVSKPHMEIKGWQWHGSRAQRRGGGVGFFSICERGLVDTEASRQLHGLEAYWRFRDDIAMLATDVFKMEALVKKQRERANTLL